MSSTVNTTSAPSLMAASTSVNPSSLDAATAQQPHSMTSATATATAANSNSSSPTNINIDEPPNPLKRTATSNSNSAATSSSLPVDKDGNQLSAKKLRRLEKNRLSARECRRRKREATEHIQRQINVLEGDNLRLRLQLRIGKEAEESAVREQTKLTHEISTLLQSGASEAEIYAALESFKEKYADYGRDRRSAMEYHLRNVEHLLMPTQTTSVVMRAIQGGDKAVSTAAQAQAPTTSTPSPAATSISSSETTTTTSTTSSSTSLPTNSTDLLQPKALFQLLVNHLDVTPAQAKALSDSRMVARELDGYLAKALKLVKELRERLAQTGENLEHEFTNVRQVLTPTQAAKFLVWVANNGAAMHMLNELWERLYANTTSTTSTTTAAASTTTNGEETAAKLTLAASGDSSEEAE